MKKIILFWQLSGFIFTSLTGVLLHFLYDWTNQSPLVAPFSAINESIWEHMKLLYVPMFLFAILERQFIGKNYQNFWCVKLIGTLLGLALIPMLYYTYTGISGMFFDWLNILIFFLSAAAAYLLEFRLLVREKPICHRPMLALFVVCLIGFAFVILTYIPPQLPFFVATAL